MTRVVFLLSSSSIDADWLTNNIYVADERGSIYAIRSSVPSEVQNEPYVKIAMIYNSTYVPRAIKVHPRKG